MYKKIKNFGGAKAPARIHVALPLHTHRSSKKEEMDSEKFVVDKPHAVCIPYPIQSHVKAMLKFSKLLHHKGFRITFVFKLKKERIVVIVQIVYKTPMNV